MTLTAHDVRRIKICSWCGEMGVYKPTHAEIDVPLVICTNTERVLTRAADYQHPICYAGASLTKLMTLPKDERDFIRICDVSVYQMQILLAAEK